MKKCGHCGLEKPLGDFARNRARPDGYAPQCKRCLNAFNRAYQARNVERHGVRRCTKCGEIKAIGEFGRKAQTATGLHSWCKVCVKLDNDARVERNRMAQLAAIPPPMEAVKSCTGCGESKPLSAFYKLSAQKGGLNPRCKSCVIVYNRAYAERNAERHAEWRRTAAQRQQKRASVATAILTSSRSTTIT